MMQLGIERSNWFMRLVFRLFKKQFMRIAYFEPLSYPKSFTRMDFVFRDTNGKEYYKYILDSDIAILRKLYITEAYVNLVNCFTDADVNKSLLAIHEAINERDAKDMMKPNVAKASFICAKLLGRSGRLLNEEFLYKLAAHYFIRNDEEIGMVDETILQEKITVLKTEFREGVKAWFFDKSLDDLYPFLKDDNKLFDDLLEESKVQATAFTNYLKQKHDGGQSIS